MSPSTAVVLIPARFASTRFPGKPLAPIWGKPMIQWVYERASQSMLPTYVVSDDERIEKCVRSFGGQCLRVDDNVPSGSERLGLAYERFLEKNNRFEFVINVQGDEPLIVGSLLNDLVNFHRPSTYDITTLVRQRKLDGDYHNPNVVKAIYSESSGKCFAFTRAAVPVYRGKNVLEEEQKYFQHIGVYCYRSQALKKFIRLSPSTLEMCESLEQWRALENGMGMGALKSNIELIGVDGPEDIKKVEEKTHGPA